MLFYAVLARVTNAHGRSEVLIGQWIKLVGATVAKYESTIATVVFAKSVAELIVAVLTMSHVVVGHPVTIFTFGLIDLVPA